MNGNPALEVKTPEGAAVLLSVLVNSVGDLTKEVRDLRDHMATKAELETMRQELLLKIAELRSEFKADSPGTKFGNFLTLITKLGAALGVLGAWTYAVVEIVRYIERLRSLAP